MTTPSLGTIKGTIKIDYDGAGVAKADTDMDGMAKKSVSAKEAIGAVSKASLGLGVIVAGGFAVAVKSAANFEQKMSDVKAVSGATAQDMDVLRKKALQLGKDTQFSASEAADAIGELAKAGVSIPEIMNGAADATVALAAAGGIALPEAATLAANAMNGFGLAAKDLPRVADLVAGAANASAIDVSEFGFSLQQVAAVAHLAGISFDDTATAIALLGNAGIKGSDAGTSLKTVFQNLIPTTKQQIELSKKLGLITKTGANAFFDASGKAKSLAQISQVLQNALRGMSKEQQLATLQTLFGSDAIRAAAVLADNGAAGFNTLAASMGKVKAADVAATKMDNLKGSIEQMKGSLETAGIQVGSIMLPKLKQLTDHLTQLVNWFSNLSPKTQNFILEMAAAAGALGGMTFAVIQFVKVVKTIQEVLAIMNAWTIWTKIAAAATKVWTAAQWLLNLAMSASPVLLIVLAVIALVAIIAILWIKSAAFRNFFIGIWNHIWSFLKTIGAWFAGPFANFFVALWQKIVTVFNAIWSVVQRVMNFFAPLFQAVFGAVIAIVQTWWSVFSALWTVVFTILKAVLMPFINELVRIWKWAFGIVIAAAKIWWNVFSAFWGFIWPYLQAFVRIFVDDVVNRVRAVFNFIVALAKAWWATFSGFWSGLWNVLSTVVRVVWDDIKARIKLAIDFISAVLNGFTSILGKVKGFFDGLKNAANGGVESLIKYVGAIPGRILSALSGIGSSLYSKGQDLIQGFINGIQSMAGKVRDILVGLLPGPLKKFAGALGLASPSKLFKQWGAFTVQGFINGVTSMKKRLAGVISSVASLVTSPVVVVGPSGSGSSGVDSAAARAASRPSTPPGDRGSGRPPGPMTVNNTVNVSAPAPLVDPQALADYTLKKLNNSISTRSTPVTVGAEA